MVIQLNQTASDLRNILVNYIVDSIVQFKYASIPPEKTEVFFADLHIKDARELENAITRAISDIANNENIEESARKPFATVATTIADEVLYKDKEALISKINSNIDHPGAEVKIILILKGAIKEAIDPLINVPVVRQAMLPLRINHAKAIANEAKSVAAQAKSVAAQAKAEVAQVKVEVTQVRADANAAKAYANQVANTKAKLGIGGTSIILGAACVALVVLNYFNKLPPVVNNQVSRLEMCAAVFIILGIVSLTEKLLTPSTQLAQSHANTAVPDQQSKV